jgi:hypothetical protein
VEKAGRQNLDQSIDEEEMPGPEVSGKELL